MCQVYRRRVFLLVPRYVSRRVNIVVVLVKQGFRLVVLVVEGPTSPKCPSDCLDVLVLLRFELVQILYRHCSRHPD